jgi:hypothetical protein
MGLFFFNVPVIFGKRGRYRSDAGKTYGRSGKFNKISGFFDFSEENTYGLSRFED